MSASTSSTPIALHVTAENAASAHPSLKVTIPASFLDVPKSRSRTCEPYILIKLPPGLFLDPNTFPINREKDVGSASHIRNVSMLQGYTPTGWDYTRVELEGVIGYSVSAHERAMIATGKRTAKLLGGAKDPLIREYTAALLSLQRRRRRNGVAPTLDDNPQSQQIDLIAPLHTRYPIAVGRPEAMLELNDDRSVVDQLANAGEAILKPPKGSYTTLLLEQPHAFWSCSGQDDILAVETGVYERTTVDDLLAPMHTHLRLPSELTSRRQLYALLPPFSSSREPFRIRIPAGQAELGLLVQALTFASLLLASIFIMFNVRSAVRSLRR